MLLTLHRDTTEINLEAMPTYLRVPKSPEGVPAARLVHSYPFINGFIAFGATEHY